ncbi:hypothetical protein [Bifidobacterium aquikefiri]|nr:hypothetical protein [Bifidobacterium aquikefiri]
MAKAIKTDNRVIERYAQSERRRKFFAAMKNSIAKEFFIRLFDSLQIEAEGKQPKELWSTLNSLEKNKRERVFQYIDVVLRGYRSGARKAHAVSARIGENTDQIIRDEIRKAIEGVPESRYQKWIKGMSEQERINLVVSTFSRGDTPMK